MRDTIQQYRPKPIAIMDADILEAVEINGIWRVIDHPSIIPAASQPLWLN